MKVFLAIYYAAWVCIRVTEGLKKINKQTQHLTFPGSCKLSFRRIEPLAKFYR